MPKSYAGHRNGSPDAADTLTPARLVEIGGSIPISQVQELRKIPSALPSLFPPSAVQGFSLASVSTTSLRATWSAPSNNGGSAILGYKIAVIDLSDGSAVYQSAGYDSSPFVALNLTNGVTYQVRVAAVNAIGQGVDAFGNGAPTAVPPSAPTALTATAGQTQLELSWTAPASDGGSAINGYTISYTPNGGATQTEFAAGTSFTLTGLTSGVQYTVSVVANNAAGASASSSSVSVTTLGATPAAPVLVSAVGGVYNGIISISWTAPYSPTAITQYQVEQTSIGGVVNFNLDPAVNATSWAAALTNGVTYQFRIRAVNSAGAGPYSNALSATASAPAGCGDC